RPTQSMYCVHAAASARASPRSRSSRSTRITRRSRLVCPPGTSWRCFLPSRVADRMYAAITTDPVSADIVLRHVGEDGDGAVCVFVGVVRDHNEGRPVRGVHYSAYESMATKVLTEIAGEAAVRAGT